MGTSQKQRPPTRRAKASRWLLAAALLTLAACAPSKWNANLGAPAKLTWPPPPNPTRIEYLGSLHRFTPEGKSLRTIIFGHDRAGTIIKPVAICMGDDGRMAIVDAEKRGVHLFIPNQQRYMLLTRAGDESFKSPVSAIFDANLNLAISDSTRANVFLFDSDGKFVKEISPPPQLAFVRPTGLAYQEMDNRLYVVDSKANLVNIFSGQGQYLTSFGKRGMNKGDLNIPTHIAAGPDGKIYVNDAMNFRVQIFNPQGEYSSGFGHHGDGSGDFAMPKGIAVDRSGVVYVAETLFDAVQLFSRKGDYLLTLGSQGRGPGEFWMPSGLFIDRENKLYVCDTFNQRIQVFQLYGPEGGGRP